MAFDLTTAKPVEVQSGFDLSTAKPVQEDFPAYEPGPYSTAPKKQIMGPWEVVGEPALNMATSIGSTAIGGLVGAGTMIGAGFSGELAKPGGFDTSMQRAGNRIQAIQQAGTYQPRSEVGKTVTNAVNWPMEKATEGWGMIGEQVGNALGDANTAAAGKALGQGGFQALMTLGPKPWKLGEAPPPTEAGLMNELGQVVNKGFAVGVKPSSKGVTRNSELINQRKLNAETVKSILKDKDVVQYTDQYGTPYAKGRIPETAEEMLQAHAQRKLSVIAEADKITKSAGGKGITVPLDETIAALEDFTNKASNIDNFKDAVAYAKQKIEDFKARGEYTPQEATEAMVIFNNKGKIHKKTPTTLSGAEAVVDGIIAETTRKVFNRTIEDAEGPGFAPLRKELGALISSEEAVTKSAIRAEKFAETTSPLRLMDVFSLSNIGHGLATGDWIGVAKGLGLGVVSEKIRIGRDPNAAIGAMFKKADKINTRLQGLLTPDKAASIVAEFNTTSGAPNALALPAPTGEVSMYQHIVDIAQTPGGMEFLTEKLGRTKGDVETLRLIKEAVDTFPTTNYPLVPVPNTQVYHIPKTNALGQ